MSGNINRVNISGNLTRDAQLRSTTGGTQILSFGVAVNDRRRNQQSGEWEDYPNYIDCVLFGSRADALSRYLFKGTKVAIEGKLSYSSWEAKDGTKRSKLEVIVDEVELMSRDDGQGATYHQPAPQPAQQPFAAAATAIASPAAAVYDEDIPFDRRSHYGA